MRPFLRLPLAALLLAAGSVPGTVSAQESESKSIPCRDLPCGLRVDWTRAGGYSNQVPDRRYGNPTHLEDRVKAQLTERGFTSHGNTSEQGLHIVLVPRVGNAMCDEMAGTATDRSCRAILDIEARLEGPDDLRKSIDLPSRIRNQCSSDRMMPVDRLGVFVGDWIAYALEGKAKGERRPIARC